MRKCRSGRMKDRRTASNPRGGVQMMTNIMQFCTTVIVLVLHYWKKTKRIVLYRNMKQIPRPNKNFCIIDIMASGITRKNERFNLFTHKTYSIIPAAIFATAYQLHDEGFKLLTSSRPSLTYSNIQMAKKQNRVWFIRFMSANSYSCTNAD